MPGLDQSVTRFLEQPPAQMWARISTVAPPWVSLVLVAAIAWQLAQAAWLFVPSEEPAVAPPAATAPAPRRALEPAADVLAIVQSHWFGEAQPEAEPAGDTPPDAPVTRLNLQLRGTIAADEAGRSLAIIAEGGGKEHVYAVGDPVPGNATLHAVYTDRVLLRRAGQLETLPLPRAQEGGGATATAQRRRAATVQPATASNLQQVISRNPARLTDIIRPQPVFRDGQQQGYRVYPGRERQSFAQLGLRPGDMITQINGMPLDDPARGMEIFRSLGDATQVSVTVERNGQTQVLTLDTGQLQGLADQGGGQAEQ